ADTVSAMNFVNRQPAIGGATAPPIARPDFTPPPRPAPRRNEMLEGSLKRLAVAFDTLSQSSIGDAGGFRAQISNRISVAAIDILTAINAANAGYRAGRPDFPPCSPTP